LEKTDHKRQSRNPITTTTNIMLEEIVGS